MNLIEIIAILSLIVILIVMIALVWDVIKQLIICGTKLRKSTPRQIEAIPPEQVELTAQL